MISLRTDEHKARDQVCDPPGTDSHKLRCLADLIARAAALMWTFTKSVLNNFIDDEALSRGGAIAFFTATSIAPVLLLVVSIAGLAFGEQAARGAVFDQLKGLMGASTADIIQTALANASSKSSGVLATLAGFAMLIVTASGVFGELQSALNKIWKAEPKDTTISRFVRARAVSLGLVATLGFLLIVSLVVSTALTAVGTYFGTKFAGWTLILSVLNFVISFCLLSLLFAAVYKVLPDCPVAWRDVGVGAGVTAALFMIGKTLIGWYLGSSAIASTYGAAGGLMVLLIWIYYSTQIFLLGAEITKTYAMSRDNSLASGVAALSPSRSRKSDRPTPALVNARHHERKLGQVFERKRAAPSAPVLFAAAGIIGLILGLVTRSRNDS